MKIEIHGAELENSLRVSEIFAGEVLRLIGELECSPGEKQELLDALIDKYRGETGD